MWNNHGEWKISTNNTPSIGKQINNGEPKILLGIETLIQLSKKTRLEIYYCNKKNANKKLLLCLEDYIIYNIF